MEVGDPLDWSDEDIQAQSEVTDADVSQARAWNARHMPPPMQRLNEAPAEDTEDEARADVQQRGGA